MTPFSLRIHVIDDEEVIRESLSDFLKRLGHQVFLSANADHALETLVHERPDLMLLDIRMPGQDGLQLLEAVRGLYPDLAVIMVTGHGTMELAIEALRLGANDFLKKPIKLQELTQAIARIQQFKTDEPQGSSPLEQRPTSPQPPSLILGDSPATRHLRSQVALAAQSSCPSLLITGETGTGKEVVARAFHQRCHVKPAPFVALNCPAIPDSLLESELFGHRRGSFTGADMDRQGAFERAHEGTLFLDEISELSLQAQAKLLRVLETRLVRRVGDDRERKVNVKVVAAANRNLVEQVDKGQFRSDLFYRLSLFHMELLPLRERLQDLAALAPYFLANHGFPHKTEPFTLATEAMDLLKSHDYPGNVRELRNILERAVMLSQGPIITPALLAVARRLPAQLTPPPQLPESLPAQEAQVTLAALAKHRWNRRQAAQDLGISYESLRWRIKKHHLMP